MKVFITGGAGFIGSHLSERLLAEGSEVLILDDLSTGSISNIEHLIGKPGFNYRIGTVMDEPLVAEMVDRCDFTIHLAAAVGVKVKSAADRRGSGSCCLRQGQSARAAEPRSVE